MSFINYFIPSTTQPTQHLTQHLRRRRQWISSQPPGARSPHTRRLPLECLPPWKPRDFALGPQLFLVALGFVLVALALALPAAIDHPHGQTPAVVVAPPSVVGQPFPVAPSGKQIFDPIDNA